ncbi:MAG: hypothetical protein K9L68_09010 [Spirochaetales bacterium]|nr:hypothetical protein [Spirochaetales bacterium]MCF7938725.1 hypothetical protein [Spirochaetales bacterium]
MKMSPFYVKAQDNMQPGIITSSGFLGDDTRPIVDIIEHDEEIMQQLGLDFEEVANRLHELMEEGRKGLGEPITYQQFLLQVYEARGFLPSPFEDGIFRKVNVNIENKKNGKTLLVSELSIHLLQQHHFLQGRGSPYRLEPEDLKGTLEL